jgi:hypothetical protein
MLEPGTDYPDGRFGSFATELVKVDAGTCPLRSESDRNIAVPRMNAIAKSGPTTPASGCISCRGVPSVRFQPLATVLKENGDQFTAFRGKGVNYQSRSTTAFMIENIVSVRAQKI